MNSTGLDTTDYHSAAANYISRKLKEKGFDSIIYINENMDRGSMGVIPLDPGQLIPVTRNDVAVKNDIEK